MSADFMPLDGWDHIELWVGNAKQAAYFYEHALGFTRVAYGGPETGIRDRASYVLEQGEIRLVLTSGLRSDSEVVQFVARHGDGAKDVALAVPDAAAAYREAVERGATGVVEPHRIEDEHGAVELATFSPYVAIVATMPAPTCRASSRSPRTATAPGESVSWRSTTSSATSSSGAWTGGSSSTSACSGW